MSDEDFEEDGETIFIDEEGEGELTFEEDDDEGDGDVEMDGGENEEDDDVNLIENTYYAAKGEEDITESIEMFQSILDMQGDEKSKWGFKALKQIIKRLYSSGRYEEMTKRFQELLRYGSFVSRNENENAINKILSMVSCSDNSALMNSIYNIALSSLRKSGNDKLWFNTKLQQGRSLTLAREWGSLETVVEDLKKWCCLSNGREDPKKSSNLLDVFVLEIQMYTDREELKKLKDLYMKCRKIELKEGAVVSNPNITGIIRECGGKMNMREKQWALAYADFFDAFKSYDEAGNLKRIACLKYLVLVSMLRSSAEGNVINPLESSPEAKPYRNHKEIQAMTTLISAYDNNDIDKFERTLKSNYKQIQGDPFMAQYISDLLRSIRLKVLLNLIKPYKRIRLSYLANSLNIHLDVVEALCSDLILDQRLKANIDQINGLLNLESINRNQSAKLRYDALDHWTQTLATIHKSVVNKVD